MEKNKNKKQNKSNILAEKLEIHILYEYKVGQEGFIALSYYTEFPERSSDFRRGHSFGSHSALNMALQLLQPLISAWGQLL